MLEDCQPFFLGLIGGRYGWTPLPTSLSRATGEQFSARADAELKAAFSACNPYGICLSVSDGCLHLACVSRDGTVGLYELAGRRAP